MEIKVLSLNQKNDVFYTVQYGDTFESISKIFSVPTEYIKQNNPGSLYKGKVLYLPEVNFSVYVVKPFDTLKKIANDFGTTVESLVKKNSLDTAYVFIGQKLYV